MCEYDQFSLRKLDMRDFDFILVFVFIIVIIIAFIYFFAFCRGALTKATKLMKKKKTEVEVPKESQKLQQSSEFQQ